MHRSIQNYVQVLAILLLGLFHPVVDADCANPSTFIWFSTSATAPAFAEVPLVNSAEPPTLYIWAQLADEETITDLSLNVTSTSPLAIASAALDNPNLGVEAGTPVKRFEHLPAASIASQRVELQGFTLLNQDAIGRGFGKSARAVDPLFDAVVNAWRLGSVVFSSSSDNQLTLQVGPNGIQGVDQADLVTPDFGVIFGDQDDAALCAMSERGVSSSRTDALITHGTLTIESMTSIPGPYVQSTSAVLKLSIGSDKVHTPWQIQRDAQLAGTLEILTAGYSDPITKGTTDKVTLVTAESLTGNFDAVWLDGRQLFSADDNLPRRIHEGEGLFRTFAYSDESLTMTNHRALPGDFNLDMETNFADFLILSGNFGSPGDWTDGDATGNGNVEFADFLILSQWFGTQATPQPMRSVPEPLAGSCLLTLAIVFCPSLRRQRSAALLENLSER